MLPTQKIGVSMFIGCCLLMLADEPHGGQPSLRATAADLKGTEVKAAETKQPVDGMITTLLTQGGETSKPLHLMQLSAKTDVLELLPATIAVPTSKRAVLIAAKCKSKVGWFITNSGRQPVEFLQLPDQPFILVFPNPVDEQVNVHAYTAVDGVPVMAKAVIVVGRGQITTDEPPKADPQKPDPQRTDPQKPDPQRPDPDSGVRPLVPGSRVHFTIIHDSVLERTNPQSALLVAAPELVRGLEGRGHWRWLYDRASKDDAVQIQMKGFDEYVKRQGALPLFVIQDERGTVIDCQPLQGGVAAILAYVDKVAPPKK